MRATHVMGLALFLYILGRWANNQDALSIPIVISGAVLVFGVSLIDSGETEHIATVLAWLVFFGASVKTLPALGKAIVAAETRS